MVVFKNGRPSKNDYRKFKVSVDKNDDYNTMREIIFRRYSKVLSEGAEKPDLILADGGEKQVKVVQETLQELGLEIMVCGLKKNDKHRTNDLVLNDLSVKEVDRSSNVFHFLTRMQDEVHRYTINYHRTIRSKGSIGSVLDEVTGIGKKRKKELIKHFGSVKNMKQASVEDFEAFVPSDVAKNLYDFLKEFK